METGWTAADRKYFDGQRVPGTSSFRRSLIRSHARTFETVDETERRVERMMNWNLDMSESLCKLQTYDQRQQVDSVAANT